jgi:hypothetical protein
MRRTAIALGMLGLVLAASGCASSSSAGRGSSPLLRRLTEQRAYDQALCAARSSAHPERGLAYVGGRLDADARPRLHLHAVPRAELERTLGEAGRRLAEQAVLVRAVVAIDGVQVDDFGLRVALIGPQGPIESQPPSVEVLAGLVGETIPPDRVDYVAGGRELVPQRFRERPLLGITAGVLEASTLFVVPVTLITGHSRDRPSRTIVSAPTDAEVLAAAPVASVVAEQAAQSSYVEHGEGQEVASVWLWPRPAEGDLKLVVEWSYAAYGCAGRRPAMLRRPLHDAEIGRTVELPLPRGGDLESRVNALFGDRMRSVVP